MPLPPLEVKWSVPNCIGCSNNNSKIINHFEQNTYCTLM